MRYALPQRQRVTLRLYDALGRRVATLVQGREEGGRIQRQIDGTDLPSGVYFLRLRAENAVKTTRLTVVR